MSCTVTAFAVELSGLRAIVGCRDDVLRSAILCSREEAVRDNTAWFQRRIDLGAPTLDCALGALFDGSALDPQYAFQYVYALELLCEHFGERLPNEAYRDIHDEFLDFVEWALAGSQLSILDVVSGGAPIPLPRTSAYPLVGHLPADRVRPALDTLVDLDVKRRRAARRPRLRRPASDADLQRAIEDLRTWLERASHRGWGLVCFYY